MKHTIQAALAFAAAMTFLPAALTAAPEKAPAKDAPAKEAPAKEAAAKEKPAAEAPAPDEGPTPAQLKARKAKKPVYMKASEAVKVAEEANQPILMFVLLERDPISDFLRQKVISNKLFRDELAKQNVVMLTVKIKPEQPKGRERPKKIDLKGMKDADRKLIENYGLDEKAAKQAAAAGQPERTYMDIVNYPAVIGLSPDGSKQLFRMGRYDRDGGMGVWIATVADTLRAAGFEPVVTPKIQKVLDNPDDPRKWK